jgi:predicted RNase H-like nuclease (RuvC/YqgF family)
METDIITILLSMLGSSVLTALITTLGRRKTDQVAINNTLLENARKDIAQIRTENGELRAMICALEKKIATLKTDIEEREILIRIAEKENEVLKEKVEHLVQELGIKNKEIVAMQERIKELERSLEDMKSG